MANTTGKKFGGRKKGTPNKSTILVKNAIIEAFEKAGGVKYLVKLAEDDPKTFCTLLAKVIPTQITGPDDLSGTPTQITFITPVKGEVIEHDGDE